VAIGTLFHIIHITGDLAELDAWYDDVFACTRGFLDQHYLDVEKRDASLVVIGNAVVEPLAPSFHVDGWDTLPIGKFYNRFGQHWHSIAWYSDDTGAIWENLRQAGVRVFLNGGLPAERRPADEAIMTHPRDTVAQLEFMRGPVHFDTRFQPGHDPGWWAASHPLTLEYLHSTAVVTRDLGRAKRVYVDALGGTLLAETESKLTGTHSAFVLVGDTIVELAEPTGDGLAAADLERNGEIHHSATWKVRDLDAAARHLGSRGVSVLDRDAHTLLADPATTHGAPMRFTDVAVAGDPRA
jgi:catechol 2,3-dioxygenase-like lactoylglutathione lyase family enzyme